MKVIADASILIHLSAIGRFYLLAELFEEIAMYAEGEISASRASQMLGIPRAAFYSLLAETNTPLPQKLNESIKRELKELLEEEHMK